MCRVKLLLKYPPGLGCGISHEVQGQTPPDVPNANSSWAKLNLTIFCSQRQLEQVAIVFFCLTHEVFHHFNTIINCYHGILWIQNVTLSQTLNHLTEKLLVVTQQDGCGQPQKKQSRLMTVIGSHSLFTPIHIQINQQREKNFSSSTATDHVFNKGQYLVQKDDNT